MLIKKKISANWKNFVFKIATKDSFRNTILKPTIMDVICLDFLMYDKIFFSPQVKQTEFISNKYDICEFPCEFSNDVRLSILGNYKI